MFALPNEGLDRSVTKHNCNLDVVADWIELNLLFSRERNISQSDFLDILLEDEYYDNQEFAYEFIENTWNEIKRRHSLFGNNKIYSISKNSIQSLSPWKNNSVYSFLVSISMKTFYNLKLPDDIYLEQGYLFELLTEESLNIQFPQWTSFRTGWNKDYPINFEKILLSVEQNLNILRRDTYKEYITPYTKELKMDIILYRGYTDNLCNIPIFLVQCASGRDWKKKLNEPNVEQWKEILRFNSFPIKAFAMPFSLREEDFVFNSVHIKGFLLDRNRISSVYASNKTWPSKYLRNKLNQFTSKIVKEIPLLN